MVSKDGDAVRAVLYDAEGVYAQDEQYLLRAIKETDKEDYLRYYRANPIWKQYFDNPKLDPSEGLWRDFIHPGIINTVIIRKKDGAYCGFCGLQEFLKSETPELSVEIMEEFQHQGIGTTVVPMLMKHYAEKTGTHEFLAKVSPDNLPSQGLMRKLGATPSGVTTHPGISADIAKMMEEIDSPSPDYYNSLVEEFGTSLKELRSHVLVFRFKLD